MSRRTVKAYNSANTYLLGMLFCACVIVSTNVDNEGKGIANTGHNKQFSLSTNRDINGERTTTFTTYQGGTLDESWKHETINETRALESTVLTTMNKRSTEVLLGDERVISATDIMPSTTYIGHESTTRSNVIVVDIPQDTKLISERMLQLYAENETIGLTAVAVFGICPEWIPCFDAVEFHSIAQTDNSCCMSCKCDDSCASTWNCCPGYESIYTQGRQIQDLEFSPICFNTALFTNQTEVIQQASYHYVVASCPDNTPQGLKNKCSAVLKNAETNQEFIHAFSDIIPVTDSVTVTNFLNVHCATCNGITNEKLIFWKAKFSCYVAPFNINDRDMLERFIQEREECHLLLLPPNNLIGNATRCFNNVETRCNITGLWREYDREVEGFCNTINWLYITLGTNKRYKNLFCAICNGELNIRTSRVTCPYNHMGNVKVSFTGILNFKGNTRTPLSQAFDYCPVGQLFDPLKGSCQNVVCSIPRVLNYITKECDNLFDEITIGLIELPFEFFPKEPFYLVDISYYEHVFAQVIRYITDSVDCSMYSTFYKLDTPFSMFADQTYIRYGKITSVIIIVVANVRLPELRSPSEIINLFLKVSEWAPISFRYGRSDLFNLPSSELDMEDKDDSVKNMYIKDTLLSGANIDKRQFAMYEDPYDGAAVFHVGRIAFDDEPCNTPYLFDRYHFECPSFLYDIERAGMVRVRQGLLLIHRNITLTFGEFKSMNVTHVAVCIESIQENVLVSQSSSGNDLSLVFEFLNQLLITLVIVFTKLIIYV